MAEIKKSLKGIWLKSMEAISKTASSIASNTRYKVDEMNIVNRRREILSDFGAQAYELWQKGEHFPESMEALLQELSQLDESLNAIRTEKLAGIKTDEEAPAADQEEPAPAGESEPQEQPAPAQEKPAASVSEKIDSAVETVGVTLRKLGSKIEGGIEALSRAMKPKPEEKSADDVPVGEGNDAAEEQDAASAESASVEDDAVPVIEVAEEEAQDSEPVTSQPELQTPRAPEIELPGEDDPQG